MSSKPVNMHNYKVHNYKAMLNKNSTYSENKGSYMSAHVSLNLLNESRKKRSYAC